ncbi:MAG: hypothetical protein DDG58_14775 [Ardenticatenia bacterium]|nr:MAG: hypothetical protein DDG58_14775 [Ardenticatenia bacterium]
MSFCRAVRYLLTLIGVLMLLQANSSAVIGHSRPVLSPTHAWTHPESSWQPDVPSAKKSCSKMVVSDPALWFEVDENGDPDLETVVESYPSGVVGIVAGFEYNCVPSKTTVATIFYALNESEDKPWYTSEIKLAPTDKPGVLWRGIRFKDRRPIPDGDYRVEFFLGKRLLTAGEVTVGGAEEAQELESVEEQGEEPEPDEAAREPEKGQEQEREKEQQRDNKVQIDGRIIDGGTQKPIKGAVFIVLNPGITTVQWADYGFPPSDIMTANRTDPTGRFRHPGLERGVEYSIVAWALSYAPYYHDGFILSETDPDPYPMTIELYR